MGNCFKTNKNEKISYGIFILIIMNWSDLKFFNDGTFEEVWKEIQKQRRQGKNILPSNKNIFKAFELVGFEEVKVVIVGQDPYPTAKPYPHAHGLAFSAEDYVNPFPKSLSNIFKEICDDVGGEYPSTPNLTRWAEQGVLLLNTSLTVIENCPGSHKDIGWHKLTTQAIQALNDYRENLVFMLWGTHAIKKARYIDENKHLILTASHPSPLSANKGGWFGCKHFSKANEYLVKHNKLPIKW